MFPTTALESASRTTTSLACEMYTRRPSVSTVTPEERRRILREDASSRTLWAHQNESRDGRLLFENFLALALEHDG